MTIIKTDQWGTYHVGDRSFVSKLEAIQYQRQTRKSLSWNFQECKFAAHDWSIEPRQSLWELYSERAIELRQNYDYIILLYSGGADSENVLTAFERNGLMVDEIRIGYAGDYAKASSLDVWSNLELYYVAIPRAKALQKTWPSLEVSIVNMTPLVLSSLDHHTDDDLHYANNMGWSLWQRQRFGMTMDHGHDWIERTKSKKRVAVLWGKDKTFVNLVDNKYAVQFIDRHLNGNLSALPDNACHEYFYWSPDAVKILIKQGHVLKNFYRTADHDPNWHDNNSKFILKKIDYQWHYNTTQIGNKITMINNGCYNTLIYPFYDATIYDVGKIEYQTQSQSLNHMLAQKPGSEKQFESYVAKCFDFYRHDWTAGDRRAYGPKGVVSRPWFLE